MGKSSSSSLKKKRSKVSSSQARIKKKSKIRSRRKNKSKKLRPRDDSVSYSGDSSDSRNSVSVSSSSSEGYRRSRRSRSRTRKDVKSSKKRARRHSSSSERTEDTPHFRKRKGSKKSGEKKKTHERKKNKNKKSEREVSISSTSSGSWSCSTCQGGSSSSDQSEVEKDRGRYERRDKDRRHVEKVKSGSKRKRSRSRSCSSCSRYSDYRSDEQLTGEVNMRRLRSVITVVREGNEERGMDEDEERGMDEDEHKEEMVYDYDDYPSSRSNDTNDGGSKREFGHNSHVTTEKKGGAEDEKGEVVVNHIRSDKVFETNKDCKDSDGNSPFDGFKMNDAVKDRRNDDSGVIDSPNAYNLESILRQKALENLRKFQKGHQTDAKAPDNQKDLMHSDVKRLSATKAELVQNKSSKGGGDRVVVTSQIVGDDSIAAASKGSTVILQNDKNLSDGNTGCKDNGAEHDVAHPPDQVPLASSPNKFNKKLSSESYKPKLISLTSRREPSNASINKKQEPALQQEHLQPNSMTGNSVAYRKVETAQTAICQLGKTNSEEVNNTHSCASDDTSSCQKSIPGGISSNKPQDEANNDSQFEQKTMTVMRGGELVEVSYKVYIPKKTPALSRRPLKR